jgi:hypothetical protein
VAGVIAKVSRGQSMRGLLDYLFGPGRHNEHVNQHLVAGYADCEHTAPPELWASQPGTVRQVRAQARALGSQLEFPRWRHDAAVPGGHVWHCSLSVRPGEGPLTDAQWALAARTLTDILGFSGAGGKAPCRWAAVRHGTSAAGNDHIHVAVCLVREDGTKASTWHDYRKASRACAEIEDRLGLAPLAGRMTGRSVPEPSRADREISARHGDGEPVRVRMERMIRAIAAVSPAEADFVARARAHGLLLQPRFAPGRQAVTGYAVAEENGRQAPGPGGRPGPVWFGGSSLAADLSLPRLRQRWHHGTTPADALAAWTAGPLAPVLRRPEPNRIAARLAEEEVSAADAAGLLAAAAIGLEPDRPGLLSRAARSMARAAQAGPGRRPAPADWDEICVLIEDIFRITADPKTRSEIRLIQAAAGLGVMVADRAAGRHAESAGREAAGRYVPQPPQPGTAELLRDIADSFVAVATGHRQGGTPAAVATLARLTAVCAATAVAPAARPEARRAAALTARYASGLAATARHGPHPAQPLPDPAAGLPPQVAAALSRATAPPGRQPPEGRRQSTAPQSPPRRHGRPSQGRDGR